MNLLLAFDSLGFASGVMTWVGQSLLLGTLAALLTWTLARTVFRGARPSLLAALWLVVLVKFVWPTGPGWSFTLPDFFPAVAPVIPADAPAATTPAHSTPTSGGEPGLIFWMTTAATTTAGVAAAPVRAGLWTLASWLPALAVAYVFGVVVAASLRIRTYVRFTRRCRLLPRADSASQARVALLCRRAGTSIVPTVRICDTWPNAFIYGLLSPTLVLSTRVLDRGGELDAIVLHEIAHLRRGDLLVRYLQWSVGTLLFFWPVVAWVNRRIDLAREQACDEWALRHASISATDYARCLLRASQPRADRYAGFVPAAMATGASHVERRIHMIMNSSARPSRGRLITLAAGTAVAAWGAFVLTGSTASGLVRAPAVVRQDADGSGNVEAKVMVIAHVDDGQVVTSGVPILKDLPVIGHMFRSGAAAGSHGMMIMRKIENDGSGQPHDVMFSLAMPQPPEALARFLSEHPTADANADGTLTQAEHDAYLIALAMNAPAGVLATWPKADTDGNSDLSAEEAAKLVTGGPAFEMQPAAGAMNWIRANGISMKGGANVPSIDDASGAQAGVWTSDDGSKKQIRVMKIVGGSGSAAHAAAADAEAGQLSTKVELDGPQLKIITTTGDADPEVFEFKLDDTDGAVQEKVIEDGNRKIIIRRSSSTIDGNSADEVDIHAMVHDVLQNAVADTAGHMHAAIAEAVHGAVPRVIAMHANAAADGSAPKTMAFHAAEMPVMPALWLLTNVDVTPTAEQVAQYVTLAEQTPLAAFFAVHPEADTNSDGTLTTAERDAFVAAETRQARQHLLEKFPTADADGDGELTDEELMNHFKSKVQVEIDGGTPGVRIWHGQNGELRVLGSEVKVEVKVDDAAETTTTDEK